MAAHGGEGGEGGTGFRESEPAVVALLREGVAMPAEDEAFIRANGEANEAFERLRAVVEEAMAGDQRQISVLDVGRRAGLEIDESVLGDLQLPEFVPVHPWLPWHTWFPWRPLWCWWWRFRYPWYRCCPYWWYRCHWYPSL
jgi:hypothetical protein